MRKKTNLHTKVIASLPEEKQKKFEVLSLHPNGNISQGASLETLILNFGDFFIPTQAGSTFCFTPEGMLVGEFNGVHSEFILAMDLTLSNRVVTLDLHAGDTVIFNAEGKLLMVLCPSGIVLEINCYTYTFNELMIGENGHIEHGFLAKRITRSLKENALSIAAGNFVYFDKNQDLLIERSPLAFNTPLKLGPHLIMAQKQSQLDISKHHKICGVDLMKFAELVVGTRSVAFMKRDITSEKDISFYDNYAVKKGRLRESTFLPFGKTLVRIPKRSDVTFYPNGLVESVRLSKNLTIKGRLYKKEALISVARSGEILGHTYIYPNSYFNRS